MQSGNSSPSPRQRQRHDHLRAASGPVPRGFPLCGRRLTIPTRWDRSLPNTCAASALRADSRRSERQAVDPNMKPQWRSTAAARGVNCCPQCSHPPRQLTDSRSTSWWAVRNFGRPLQVLWRAQSRLSLLVLWHSGEEGSTQGARLATSQSSPSLRCTPRPRRPTTRSSGKHQS